MVYMPNDATHAAYCNNGGWWLLMMANWWWWLLTATDGRSWWLMLVDPSGYARCYYSTPTTESVGSQLVAELEPIEVTATVKFACVLIKHYQPWFIWLMIMLDNYVLIHHPTLVSNIDGSYLVPSPTSPCLLPSARSCSTLAEHEICHHKSGWQLLTSVRIHVNSKYSC